MIKRLWRFLTANIDGFLLGTVCLLMLLGLFVLYSATGQNHAKTINQFASMLIALAVMWGVSKVPPQHLMRLSIPMYVLGIVLLIVVALFGEVVNGARRWLHVGVTRIQPAELMKIAVPMMLAWYFDKHETALRLRNYVVAALMLLVPVILIARQPDLGTAILITASGFYVLFLAGLSWRIMVTFLVLGLASLPVLWTVLRDYQRQRILTLLDPSTDPLGAGYHTIQSTIAVGSGGVTGKGWLNGTQSHLEFLPERHTDFVFAVFSEEFGLLGNLLLLVLYVLVIGRGLVIASDASTFFARLMAGAITLTFFTYAFVNMAMVAGILPVVGVPLPLVSYGGTALVTICLGLGILMSIQTHKQLVKT
ncbi:MAG TPA: rod shape-determining protein RodA [Burkholderiales bacterium]|nr:rod shape-determining protein RodA [Burkholderiales bacterium]